MVGSRADKWFCVSSRAPPVSRRCLAPAVPAMSLCCRGRAAPVTVAATSENVHPNSQLRAVTELDLSPSRDPAETRTGETSDQNRRNRREGRRAPELHLDGDRTGSTAACQPADGSDLREQSRVDRRTCVSRYSAQGTVAI